MALNYYDDFNQMDYDTTVTCEYVQDNHNEIMININGDMETFYTRLFIKSTFVLIDKEPALKTILLNFMKLNYMSSSGIASLLQIINHAKLKQIEIFFINLNDHMQKIIDALGIGHFIREVNMDNHAPIEMVCPQCKSKIIVKQMGEFNCPNCNAKLSMNSKGAI